MKTEPEPESGAGADSGCELRTEKKQWSEAADPAVTAWLKLAAARREVLAARGGDEGGLSGPPFGFAARVAALAAARRRESALSRWTLWSIRGALASAAAAVAVTAAWPLPAAEGGAPLLLRAPALEIPAIGHL